MFNQQLLYEITSSTEDLHKSLIDIPAVVAFLILARILLENDVRVPENYSPGVSSIMPLELGKSSTGNVCERFTVNYSPKVSLEIQKFHKLISLELHREKPLSRIPSWICLGVSLRYFCFNFTENSSTNSSAYFSRYSPQNFSWSSDSNYRRGSRRNC